MPGCPTDEQLAGYVAGACADEEATAIRAHAEQCTPCARWLADAEANEDIVTRVRRAMNADGVPAGSEHPSASNDAPSDPPGAATTSATCNPSMAIEGYEIHRELGRRRMGVAQEGEDGEKRALLKPDRIGPHRILRILGRGAMGTVFEGWDETLHRSVAIKLLYNAVPEHEDRHFERFLTGARTEASLRHPNIVAVHEAGLVDGVPYLVMDCVDGPTLREVCSKTGPMPLAAAMKVMWDVARALAALHRDGFIHRDLKPGNVLFDREGRVFVTDFGLASLRPRSEGQLAAAGTPTYMPAEAFRGQASFQTDVYAMGIMFYELLAGRPPFHGDSASLCDQHRNAPLPTSELDGRVPMSVIELIQRTAHKKETFRFKTAEHFRRALRRCVASDDMLRHGEIELQKLLAAVTGEQRDETAVRPNEGTPSSSYFDLLSDMAAEKRDSSTRFQASVGEVAEPPETKIREPGCAYDIPCPMCGYTLRGLTEPQCPECGYAFDWADVLDPARRLHPYLFEHHPERNFRSFCDTLVAGLRPRRFWSTLHPMQPIRPARLLLYWCLCVLPMFCAYLLLVAATWYIQSAQYKPEEWTGYVSSSAVADPAAVSPEPFYSPTSLRFWWRVLCDGVWGSGRGYLRPWTAWPLVVVLEWTLGTVCTLMVFHWSMRNAAVRFVHVSRCVVYSADVFVWAGLILMVLTVAMRNTIRHTLADPLWTAWLGLTAAALLIAPYRLTVSYDRYLRFDHPRCTVLASQIIVWMCLGSLVIDLRSLIRTLW